jgi:hypothetical protein
MAPGTAAAVGVAGGVAPRVVTASACTGRVDSTIPAQAAPGRTCAAGFVPACVALRGGLATICCTVVSGIGPGLRAPGCPPTDSNQRRSNSSRHGSARRNLSPTLPRRTRDTSVLREGDQFIRHLANGPGSGGRWGTGHGIPAVAGPSTGQGPRRSRSGTISASGVFRADGWNRCQSAGVGARTEEGWGGVVRKGAWGLPSWCRRPWSGRVVRTIVSRLPGPGPAGPSSGNRTIWVSHAPPTTLFTGRG